jgi:hypothetical protein
MYKREADQFPVGSKVRICYDDAPDKGKVVVVTAHRASPSGFAVHTSNGQKWGIANSLKLESPCPKCEELPITDGDYLCSQCRFGC